MTLTSLPAFTTPAVKVVLGTIIVACALAGLPILFVTINYLRNAVQSHGQAINRCDAKYTFLLSLIGPELVWILGPRPHVGFRIELISHTTYSTPCGHRMAHRKWKEIKQQPTLLPGPSVPGSCLVSFHFLWAILCLQAVVYCGTVGEWQMCHNKKFVTISEKISALIYQ